MKDYHRLRCKIVSTESDDCVQRYHPASWTPSPLLPKCSICLMPSLLRSPAQYIWLRFLCDLNKWNIGRNVHVSARRLNVLRRQFSVIHVRSSYLARYLVFRNEWSHSRHFVMSFIKFSRGGINPSLLKIDWFHIAPRAAIAAAAPVDSRMRSKSS